MSLYRYPPLLSTPCSQQWKRLGARRRSGVAVPLFSIYSKDSTGIGDIADLKLLVDWCVRCGLSLIQLLPLNDMGLDFRPYDTQSTFALDPVYLRLEDLKGVSKIPPDEIIKSLKCYEHFKNTVILIYTNTLPEADSRHFDAAARAKLDACMAAGASQYIGRLNWLSFVMVMYEYFYK